MKGSKISKSAMVLFIWLTFLFSERVQSFILLKATRIFNSLLIFNSGGNPATTTKLNVSYQAAQWLKLRPFTNTASVQGFNPQVGTRDSCHPDTEVFFPRYLGFSLQ